MLASVLDKARLRTGLFISPHVICVEERMQINGQPIARAELTACIEETASAIRRLEHEARDSAPVTFFEIATALGFLYFARRGVDVAVIEVGLGGRFDSTNVCVPLLSIITSISYDHTQVLGNTLASIAREKAGIIKPGRPILNGAREPEPRQVIEEIARERQAPLRQLDVDFRYVYEPASFSAVEERWPRVQVTTETRVWPALPMGLLGEHQAANASLVVAAVEQLRGQEIAISDDAVAAGIADVRWPARLEIVGRRPWVILDCAHNLASAQALVEALRTSFPAPARGGRCSRRLIFAGNRDKDLAGMLRVLSPHFDHMYFTRFNNNPRHVAPERLAEFLPPETPQAFSSCATSSEAWQQARAAAGPDDLICITGSVFLAAELRPLILGENRR